jgi:hypothetical protein
MGLGAAWPEARKTPEYFGKKKLVTTPVATSTEATTTPIDIDESPLPVEE